MKCEIFYVTYAKDFPWLVYSLRSINKFASGFSGVTIVVPDSDVDELFRLAIRNLCGIPIICKGGNEWPDKGMMWHEAQICRADEWCPDADFVAHFDPDAVFTEVVTPESFFVEGKPKLQFERFDTIGVRTPGCLKWKEAVEKCLPFECPNETMRGLPHVYHRELYGNIRDVVSRCTMKPFDDYVHSCENSFPQTFCEFNTLGNVAMKHFPDKYHLVDNGNKPNPNKSDFPVQQFWSHGAIDKPQDVWVRGEQKSVVPLEMIKELGLL